MPDAIERRLQGPVFQNGPRQPSKKTKYGWNYQPSMGQKCKLIRKLKRKISVQYSGIKSIYRTKI